MVVAMTLGDGRLSEPLTDFAKKLMSRGLVIQHPRMACGQEEAQALTDRAQVARSLLMPALLKPADAVPDGIKSMIRAEIRTSWAYYMKVFGVSADGVELEITFPDGTKGDYQGHMNVLMFPEAAHGKVICL